MPVGNPSYAPVQSTGEKYGASYWACSCLDFEICWFFMAVLCRTLRWQLLVTGVELAVCHFVFLYTGSTS